MRRSSTFVRAILATLLFAVVLVLALPQPAPAEKPITVGNGTPASCTETALKDALIIAETVGGATIRFNCGSEPVTIALSQVTTAPGLPVLLVLPNNTTLDGGGLITLDGTHTATVVFVDRDTTVVLTRLSIIHGRASVGGGTLNLGTLTVDHSTLSGNAANVDGGGISNTGTLTVRSSTFDGNVSDFGGGISNSGTLTVDHSTFSGNVAHEGGGIYSGGTLTVEHSTFAENQANVGRGGGIFVVTGTLRVDHSAFSDNTGAGGGVYMSFLLASGLVTHSTFSGNGPDPDIPSSSGGGIVNLGTLTVEHSTISQNTTGTAGGGIANLGTLTVDHSTITQNIAGTAGGGIYNQGTLTLTKTSVTENTPDDIFP
jgi:predicted outer membrane repeat protein